MAAPFPFTHYACPCSDLTSTVTPVTSSIQTPIPQSEEDHALNPHDPRANHALYPLDQLLYCDECDAVRCQRCWTDEILYWYCPSCLFEVPSSAVRADGNRCSRSCYNCPSCTAPLAIVALPGSDGGLLRANDCAATGESYILHCQYCEWSSLDIDVAFSKATKITEQLAKLQKSRSTSSRGNDDPELEDDAYSISHDGAFTHLSKFYKEQLSESAEAGNPFSSSSYNSPANLARIMSLYGGLSYNALKKTNEKPQPMREALQLEEGLVTLTLEGLSSDATLINSMERNGWHGTSSHNQQLSTPANAEARLVTQLWPMATPLRTRRGKRCRACRQFLARPDPKVSSMRYRIRLLAQHYLPQLAIKPLQANTPASDRFYALRLDVPKPPPLKPFEAKQYLLSVRNPVFETIQVTLATPASTPGRIASRVTILCPSFAVGPAGDAYDEALSASQPEATDGGRRAAMASLTGSADADRQPEAGKIWERTRNTTSVIVEIVPGSPQATPGIGRMNEGGATNADGHVTEDDLVLEVPIYLRAEWEVEVKEGESSMGKKTADRRPGDKNKKELGFWVVLGVGQIEA